MTNSSGPLRACGTAAAGSGVALKLRLAEYSLSLPFAMPDSRKLLAGASGYSFKEWKGTFYPEKMKPEDMLAFYAERLPTVEINNTFYQMPKVAVLENWARTTPDGFRFAIKASRRITHMSRLKADSAADSVAFLYRNLARARAPSAARCSSSCRRSSRRTCRGSANSSSCCPQGTARRSSSATTAGSPTTSTRPRRAPVPPLPLRARGQRAAAAGRDRAVGLRAAAAGDLLRRRPGALGGAAARPPAGARSTSTSCTSRPRRRMRRP